MKQLNIYRHIVKSYKYIILPAKSIISSCEASFNASPYSSSRSMAILSSCSVVPLVSGGTHYNKNNKN